MEFKFSIVNFFWSVEADVDSMLAEFFVLMNQIEDFLAFDFI